jgi:hypothetical protein
MDFDTDEQVRSHEVRLFPTIRIGSTREAELRATAGLLAIVKAVSEFGRAIVKDAGGPVGRLSCYTEVPFAPAEPQEAELRPDGIIRSVRGNNDWRALVEVKVGDNPLTAEQVNAYHRLAKERGFSAVITVSNESANSDGSPPVSLDGRRLKSVPVVHLSWERLLSEAKLLSQRSQVADADQAWMLEEWIRYVMDPDSRIIEHPQLGERWSEILRAAREANLPSVAKYVDELASAWDSYLRKQSLRLRAKLGVEVEPRISRSERKDPAARMKRIAHEALSDGVLRGELRIPDTAGDVSIEVGLVARTVRFGIQLEAPQEGRQQTRINWLARQLRHDGVPGDVIVKIDWDRKGLISQSKAADIREKPELLLRDGHHQLIPADASPRRFALEWTRKLQKPQGKSTVRVLEGVSEDLEKFYRGVVENLVPYQTPAPKLLPEVEQVAESGPSLSVVVEAPSLAGVSPLLEVVANDVSEEPISSEGGS